MVKSNLELFTWWQLVSTWCRNLSTRLSISIVVGRRLNFHPSDGAAAPIDVVRSNESPVVAWRPLGVAAGT